MNIKRKAVHHIRKNLKALEGRTNKNNITDMLLLQTIKHLNTEVERLKSKVDVSFEDEFKDLLKSGKIRFEMELDTDYYGNLDSKLQVYIDSKWVTETNSSVHLPKLEE